MIVLWRVTTHCNLACGFCAYDRRLGGKRQQIDPAEVERFAALLDAYRRRRGDRLLLSWLGGEPLRWRPLWPLAHLLQERYGIRQSVTTNGSSLHRAEVREAVLRHFDELTVSVDDMGERHEQLRGWQGGWARLSDSLRALAEARRQQAAPLKLRANVVLMHDNLPRFAELCEALAEWGVDEITFNALGGQDRPEFYPAHRLLPEDVMRLRGQLPVLRERLAAQGVRLCGSAAYLGRLAASAGAQSSPVGDCAPGEGFLFIDEVGRVSPCSFTGADYGVPLEAIRTVEALEQLGEGYRAMQQRQRSAACSDCRANHVYGKFEA